MKQTQKILATIFGMAFIFAVLYSSDTFALDKVNLGNINRNTKESYFHADWLKYFCKQC